MLGYGGNLKKIYCYIDYIERYDFFKRFYGDHCKVIFITSRYSLYIKAKIDNISCVLVKRTNENNSKINYTKCRDIACGSLSLKDGMILERDIYNTLNNLKVSIDSVFFIWNGSDVAERTISLFCKGKKLLTVFFEISNLPGKLFIDPLGVNAESQLNTLSCSKILSDINSLNETVNYNNYITNYKKLKDGKFSPPQAKRKSNYYFLIDHLGSIIRITTKFQSYSFINKVGKFISRFKLKNKVIEVVDLPSDSFIFLPLQVSNDSQILLNSTIGNLDAIKLAHKISFNNGLKLVVKLHPAEFNLDEIEKIRAYCINNNIILSNLNTNDLINKSKSVVTINSTVGFESLIFNKKVYFLGDSFYARFKDEFDIKNYINNYLVNVDYFGDDEIEIDIILNHIIRISGTNR